MNTTPESSIKPNFEPRRPLDDELLQAAGHSAITEGDPETPEFTELSKEQILAQFIAQATDLKIDLSNPKPTDREALNKLAHNRIFEYHHAKHAYEFHTGADHPDPPPLAQLGIRNRIKEFCNDPDTKYWVTDRVHRKRLSDQYDRYERRYSKVYAQKMPEIAAVYDLQEGLYDKDYVEAAYMLNDLLAVYGRAISDMIRAGAQARARQQQKEAEAKERAERIYEDEK